MQKIPYNYSWSLFSDVNYWERLWSFRSCSEVLLGRTRAEFTLELWFLTGDDYMLHRGHLAKSRYICDCLDWGGILASGILRPDHPTIHKRSPYNKELSSQLSTMLRLRNDALRAKYFPLLRQDGSQCSTQYPVNFSLADGNRYYSSLLWVPSILFNPFRWFFPGLQVVSSHTCPDQNSAAYRRGTLCDLWNSLCVVLFSSNVHRELLMALSCHSLSTEALLYSVISLHWSLKTLKTVNDAVGGVTLFISWLSKITVLGCLISSFLQFENHHFMYFFPFCHLFFYWWFQTWEWIQSLAHHLIQKPKFKLYI